MVGDSGGLNTIHSVLSVVHSVQRISRCFGAAGSNRDAAAGSVPQRVCGEEAEPEECPEGSSADAAADRVAGWGKERRELPHCYY